MTETENTGAELIISISFRDVYRVLLGFLRNPSSDIRFSGSFTEKLSLFLKLFFLEVILAIGATLTILALIRLNLVPESAKEFFLLPKNLVGYAIIYPILIAPIAEEFLFRFNLRLFPKYLPLQAILGAICVFYFIACFGKSKTLSIVSLSLVLSFLIFYFTRIRKLNAVIGFIWADKFKTLFYLTAAAFAMAHISKYGLSLKILLLSPFLVLPQFIMGLFAGYTRLRLGIGWSCIFHSCHNLLLVLPLIMATIIARSENYVFQITDADQSSTPKLEKLTRDTIIIEAYPLKEVFSNLLHTENQYISFVDNDLAEKKISVRFERNPRFPMRMKIPSNQIAISELTKHFDLEIIRKKVVSMEGYDLQIGDSLRFYQFRNNDVAGDRSYFTDYPGNNQLRLNNAMLWQIARSLESIYQKGISSSPVNRDIFTIIIPELKFEDLDQFLLEKYGLTLVNRPVQKETFTIRPYEKHKHKHNNDTLFR